MERPGALTALPPQLCPEPHDTEGVEVEAEEVEVVLTLIDGVVVDKVEALEVVLEEVDDFVVVDVLVVVLVVVVDELVVVLVLVLVLVLDVEVVEGIVVAAEVVVGA